MSLRYLRFALLPLVLGCSSSDEQAAAPDAGPDAAISVDDGRSCSYNSAFTRQPECIDYSSDWADAQIEQDCADRVGVLIPECPVESLLGQCELEQDDGLGYVVSAYGENDSCDLQKAGCETFGGGVWQSADACASGGGGGGNVFIQPTQECRDPLPGEPAGLSEDGKVCTWQAVAGSTEEGRYFPDYASCDVVRTQRPYYPVEPAETAGGVDARLEDESYVEELEWVTDQIKASACICCHSTEEAPTGPSNWYIEAPNNWLSSMSDTGVALGANAITSIAFGAYPPEDNNGFDRIHSGFPSTDPQRMVDFFVAELQHRGLSVSDFESSPPFGGPLHDQIFYEPEACSAGVGVDEQGRLQWTGGDARYVYVLAEGSQSPTVPPNLDTPDGTLWRIDVPSSSSPVASGSVTYGTPPAVMTQRVPAEGAPTPLVSGEAYYLYVSLDVGIPITRCLFQAP